MRQISEKHYMDLLRLPFKSGGRGPESYDCLGVARLVYARAHSFDVDELPDPGLDLPSEPSNPWRLNHHQLGKLRAGDFILGENAGGNLHVWLALSPSYVITATGPRGVAVFSSSALRRMAGTGFFRPIGVYTLEMQPA